MRESPIPLPETPSAFHPHAQRNAFRRRGARQQFRLFAPLGINGEDIAPIPTGFAEIVSDYFPVPFHAGRAFCRFCISLSDRRFFVNGHIGCVESGLF